MKACALLNPGDALAEAGAAPAVRDEPVRTRAPGGRTGVPIASA
ncbi:hypothetical protein ACFY00_15485 [Kitasatospora sp. NPDC001540]